MQMFGHTKFIDDPALNTRDRYRVARKLGFRSLLEYNVAQQMKEAGINFMYEPFSIEYYKN